MTSAPESWTTSAAASAARWLESLSSSERELACWPFGSRERGDWHYAPRARNGLALRAMSEDQRDAAMMLLASTTSVQGHAKARAIMELETVLRELRAGRGPERDPLNYAFTVFGNPRQPPWGWRLEGHHLVHNVTVAEDGSGAFTPSFWGANPARIPAGRGDSGRRVLAGEYLLGLELARTLTPAQRRDAVLSATSIGNIITERGRARGLGAPTGLPVRDLSERQREVLMRLLAEYLDNPDPGFSRPYRALVLPRLAETHLAWAGGMAEGEAFYYRLHGPRLLVEFDCTADDANHIHSVWRDPGNDWGRDVLGEHYRRHHDDD